MKNFSDPIKEVRKLYNFESMEVIIELGANTFDAIDNSIGVFDTN